jgi:SAM-dependent methyltransferase
MEEQAHITWAMNMMDIRPAHHILEIGCGVGWAVERIVPLLKSGGITAIDRSPAMISKAVKRNAAGMESGKASFITADLLQLPVGGKHYDKIFSFNVNLFWTQKAISREAAIIRSLLEEKGILYIFYGPRFAGGLDKVINPVVTNLEREHFTITDKLFHNSTKSCCFVAKAASSLKGR